jgi:hypothetical protein
MARLALARSTPEIADRAQVVVHVDQAVLTDAAGQDREGPAPRDAGVGESSSDLGSGHVDSEHPDSRHPGPGEPGPECGGQHSEGRCEIEAGAAISRDTALRLACDASLIRLVEDRDGTPLDVGRKTRTIGPALRRALRARDGGCRFPGCPETRFVEGHHLRHWAHGGPTSLGNLTELCRFHHRLLHEGGYRIEGTAPHLSFLRPDGTPIERPPPPGPCDGTALQDANRAEGLAIDAATIVSGWKGERLRLGYVVSCVVGSRDAPARAGPTPPSPPPGAG